MSHYHINWHILFHLKIKFSSIPPSHYSTFCLHYQWSNLFYKNLRNIYLHSFLMKITHIIWCIIYIWFFHFCIYSNLWDIVFDKSSPQLKNYCIHLYYLNKFFCQYQLFNHPNTFLYKHLNLQILLPCMVLMKDNYYNI